jgi:hypothetical protein
MKNKRTIIAIIRKKNYRNNNSIDTYIFNYFPICLCLMCEYNKYMKKNDQN